jgi:hypothetical protein
MNIKKVGMTALAASLASVSAQAVELSVSWFSFNQCWSLQCGFTPRLW